MGWVGQVSLRTPRHRVTVIPAVEVRDVYGATFVDGEPITGVGVDIQPASDDNRADSSDQAFTPVRLIGRGGWPGGLYSKILVEEGPYQGRMFDQQMEVREYGMSRATAHFDARFRVRGAEAK